MIVGLPNLGNTCYINSVLQLLFNNEIFRSNIDKNAEFYEKMEIRAEKDLLIKYFYDLYRAYKTADKSINVYLIQFIKCWNSLFVKLHPQNDIEEAMRFLLDCIHENCNIKVSFKLKGKIKSKIDILNYKSYLSYLNFDSKIFHKSIITDLFQTQILSRTECANCKHIKYKFDIMTVTQLYMPKDKLVLDLHDCFKFTTGITEINDFKCEKCDALKHYKRDTFWRTSNILILNLMRFLTLFKDSKIYQTKDCRHVNIPKILDISSYNSNDMSFSKYKLSGVGRHSGITLENGISAGHCTALIPSLSNDDEYILYSDDSLYRTNGILDEQLLIYSKIE